MAIFRGTGGSGNSTDDSIVSAVTEQAGIATTKAGEAATSATTATTKASEASASATTASTKATEANASATTASTKATEANTAKTAAEAAQTAAEAARDTAQTHANTANNSSVQTVAGISTEVQNVNNIRTEIQNVDTIKTDVTTVAGISSNVTTVAADASDIGTVATNIANVNNVGDNIANVNAVHSNASNINTVAADASDIGTVSSNISNVNTVAGISSDVTTVAGLESKMDTVIADASDIGAVANNIGDVTTVAGINSEVDTVAGISAKVTTVADNITDVQNADTNAANASASASQAANSASAAGASATTASTKATEASNSATAASNSATTATTKATEAAGSATTATTKATEASTSATNAATSATTATTKASEAASSATAASGSATTATTKASEASVSAASAATSATDASNAENAWSSFYATYLGSYSAPPTVDVQGNALQTGAFYYDTGTGSNTVGLYVYNGSTWVYSTNYNNVTAPYSLSQDLATNSYDINFGDNAKAKFGASDDLQIYHDGSNSYISDEGTGSLRITAQDFRVRNSANNAAVITGLDGAGVFLYHNGIQKLTTTATGIDVTGTVTADGLTVDANTATFSAGTSGDMKLVLEADTDNNEEGDTPKIQFKMDGGNTFGHVGFVGTDGDLFTGSIANSLALGTDVNTRVQFYTFDKLRQQISNNGDISFYEDTGTTPKFFWDASAERLGIGTSSPQKLLEVSSNSSPTVRISNTRNDTDWDTDPVFGALEFYSHDGSGSGASVRSKIQAEAYSQYGNATDLVLYSGDSQGVATEGMRIDYAGNVGIGTDSPSEALTVSGNIQIQDNDGYLQFKDNNAGTDNKLRRIYNAEQNLYISRRNDDGTLESNDVIIDASGKVGIGTTSPQAVLDVTETITEDKVYYPLNITATDTDSNVVNQTTASGVGVQFKIAGNNATSLIGASIAAMRESDTDSDKSTGLAFNISQNDDTLDEAMRIDSSGNVGIGTTSPNRPLTVDATPQTFGSTQSVLQLGDNSAMAAGVGGGVTFTGKATTGQTDSNTAFAAIHGEKANDTSGNTSGVMIFSTRTNGSDPAERMRIDSSGNVLVGATSYQGGGGSGAKGFYAGSDGLLSSARSAAPVAVLNRTTSDGNIVLFRKDGSTVGSIGSRAGLVTYITSGGTYSGLDFGTDINPMKSGALSDGQVNLGASGQRFLNLYLSGGVHLGGTGSANKLDDYEEGTWTPSFNGYSTGFTGTYTKIGDIVHCRILRTTAIGSGSITGSVIISGLPFSAQRTYTPPLGQIRGTTTTGASSRPYGIVHGSVVGLFTDDSFGDVAYYNASSANWDGSNIKQNSTAIYMAWEFTYRV